MTKDKEIDAHIEEVSKCMKALAEHNQKETQNKLEGISIRKALNLARENLRAIEL